MPTSTDVTKLNINELTESQYDAAVLAGTIGANDLSFLTDVNVETQVDTMPVASADELGKVYQFIGTTDANYTHGYFYECVSDGQQPATYSWSQVNVQQAGLVNTATGTSSFATGTATATGNYSVALGENSSASGNESVAIGQGANATQSGTVLIGNRSTQNNRCVAIGRAAQVPSGTIVINSSNAAAPMSGKDQDSFYIYTNSGAGAVKLMDADGMVPPDSLKYAINKYSTIPTANSYHEGWIVQYTGVTDSTYTHGYIYECVSDGGNPATYSWSALSVQAGGGGSSYTAGTGIDITSGVISVTSPTLQNNATRSGSLGILGSVLGTDTYDTVVGSGSSAGTSGFSHTGITVVGAGSTADNDRAIAIGHQTRCSGKGSIAVGRCTVSSNNTIGLNATEGVALAALNDANSMYVAIKNGVWTKLLSSDETIPAARHASLPATDGTYVLKLVISSGVPTLSWVAE